ncbi:molybdenum cofactor guanylyltransferase [Sphingomonas sp. HF-S4]|uniref:Molybdenum cofactor guanylyltransferase n=1 Tax=Sphingomonas agrestis TaxID=3080540 RepID=A0ABU3Y643_9SPHN|nr:molybdenum cofactor guanylyltransferase [Sphingomonas sp. HF-S4]MDV3456876.1 molybdenum cofactor guanylyltransferase [Sphingomonas sp. HF-S4]
MTKLLGAILAGGQSRRFGSDKAAALLDGRPLIEHVAEALARDCDALVVCGRSHAAIPFLADLPRPGLGPLGGLCAALLHGRDHGFEAVLSAPCDVPDLPAGLLARLSARPASYVAGLPVIGLWPCTLADGLRAHLDAQDDRSMRYWACVANAVPVALDQPPANINTPEALRAYRRPD